MQARAERRSLLDKAIDEMLADPNGERLAAERFVNHHESLVRRINDAFGDSDIPMKAVFDGRAIKFFADHEVDRFTNRIEDIAKIVSDKEKNTSWP